MPLEENGPARTKDARPKKRSCRRTAIVNALPYQARSAGKERLPSTFEKRPGAVRFGARKRKRGNGRVLDTGPRTRQDGS